jgi:hypothetical protein
MTFARALAAMLFSWLVFVFALLSQGCADSHESVDGACLLSFATVLEEWEVHATEPVPEHCRHLDEDYGVRVVPSDQFPWGSCDPLAVGCTVPGHMAIYLQEGRGKRDTVSTSVHEWIHALSECALGDLDAGHYRAGLWSRFGRESTEMRAQAAAVPGECL